MRFPGLHEAAGPAAFVLSGTNGGKFSVIAYAGGVIRIINLECLKIDSTYKIPLQSDDEVLTSGVFNPNGINIAIGTSKGNIYIASLREDQQGKGKFMFGRFDFHETIINQAVTSVQFSHFDPIGSFLVAFDNGVVRTWQTSVRNEQLMKVLEL
jgi:WD40 repeat protein